ncbi:7TM diverse intracellular signaling domain-containing protein [Mangrovivirga cuniculi]|uniref:7TM diverse intracellular signaling domain-containing protein n=1 Tax=Mangrovivirga cuniculi TaxID=2715131 RepID=UPI001585DFED|nr:7TM diverse intracellular signaling domain-containing protein [Mangrovivirga cuniculi]
MSFFSAINSYCDDTKLRYLPIEISDSVDQQIFTLVDLPFYVDSTNNLELKSILTNPSEYFRYDRNYSPRKFRAGNNYWIRIDIKIPENSDKYWLLEFYDQTIDEIVVFKPESKKLKNLVSVDYSKIELGDNNEFDERTFKHKNFEVLINHTQFGVYSYFVKINSHRFADIRIAVRSVNRFVYYSLNEYFLFGLLYGMILIISIYNLLMYLVIKEKKYLYYIFYILSVGFYAMCVDGIAFQYLWPNCPEWNEIAYGVFLYFIILFALLFSKKFLVTRIHAPELNAIIISLIIIRSIFFLYTLLFDQNLFDHRILDILIMAFIFFTGIIVWKRGYLPARFFVIAYGVLFIGFFIKALVLWGDIPFNTFLHYSLRISFIIEMILLSFALADRVRILKRNRDKVLKRMMTEQQDNLQIKEQLNQELEQKVAERTKELFEKNQLLEVSYDKLKDQASEIYTINNLLDLENWKLKNRLKSVVKGRMLMKKLTFEEFATVFPENDKCLHQVAHMKWNEGFKCRRCDNKKFSEGSKPYSRRCSKCGYNESATAYTLFHGIKFPLVKAFYILYVVLNHEDYMSLEEMARALSLQKNTVWNFKKKVNNFLHDEEEHGHIHAWKDVMIDLEIIESEDRKNE